MAMIDDADHELSYDRHFVGLFAAEGKRLYVTTSYSYRYLYRLYYKALRYAMLPAMILQLLCLELL